MARIRTVKPELFRHEELFELEMATKLPIRIAWVGLFTVCDREGRFKWRPNAIKLDILPYDDVDFSRVLHALVTRGLLVKYALKTRPEDVFGCILTFRRHQVVNNKETASILPDPQSDECSLCNDIEDLATRAPRDTNAIVTPLFLDRGEGKGREGKRKGKGKEDAIASRSPLFDFESLYKKYPLKKGRQEGLKRCEELILTQEDFDRLSLAIDRYQKDLIKTHTEPKYIKHFPTFIENRKDKPYVQPWRDWLDEDAGTTTIGLNGVHPKTQQRLDAFERFKTRNAIKEAAAEISQQGGSHES